MGTKKRKRRKFSAAFKAETVRVVRDIAVKGIGGASGAAALMHVNGIALQQAKGRDDRG